MNSENAAAPEADELKRDFLRRKTARKRLFENPLVDL